MTSPFPPRLSIVTLGVADIRRSKAFYERLGLKPAKASQADIVFFQMSGVVLAIHPRHLLAEDARVEPDAPGFSGVTVAQNLESPAAVDACLEHAVACGAKLVKPGQKVFWGGYSGYFADPDNHLWEIAFNPFAPIDEKGNIVLE